MTTRTVQVAGLLLLLAGAGLARGARVPLSEITIRVVNDNGVPVQGAHVLTDCYDKHPSAEGETDTNGVFQLRDHIAGILSCDARKEGYYRTHGELWGGPSSAGMVPPTNQYTVVLKKIVHPVPLVFRRLALAVPRIGEPVGLDLAEADWVVPLGRGKIADMILTVQLRYVQRRDFDANADVLFPGEGNGLQSFMSPCPPGPGIRSDLLPPQEAYADGYTNRLHAMRSWLPGAPMNRTDRKDRNYVFRVRTIMDAKGRVESANHGYMYEDICIDATDAKTPILLLKYFWNPNRTSRSLEPEKF